jgi:hypothetical protein
MSMQMTATTTDRTRDLYLASYVVANSFSKLIGIEGEPGRRIFIFDKPLDRDVLIGFHTSAEKKVLDTCKALRAAVLTG